MDGRHGRACHICFLIHTRRISYGEHGAEHNSVTTSFVAVWLTYKRSPLFALAYAANDIVLVVLWVLASLTDISYISVTICFLIFLVNDVYGFVNWLKIQKRQERTLEAGRRGATW